MAQIPLLATKLHVPRVPARLIPRSRLVECLNAGLERRLTLISAPAGYGKTTLLGEWIEGSDRPVAWISLDEGDNDPVRFVGYLIAAVRQIWPGIDLGPEPAWQMPQSSLAPALTFLINEITSLSGDRAECDCVLILDDYHMIRAQPVHDAVTFLLDHLPQTAHLVIATRGDPPLPLALLRGRGQVNELRQADLCFTHDEAAEFLNQRMGLGLSGRDLSTLLSRTEGWAAGLQMAAVSLQGRADKTDFITAFSGSDRHVLDYLVEEVLQRQPSELREFLLRTAILNRLTDSLCDFVAGTESDQSVLEQLERSNLFIVPLDQERRWYRYHRLFADLLRRRLNQRSPELISDLHLRASEWFELNGFLSESLDHALAAGDHSRSAQLLERVAEPTLMRSEVVTLLSWLEALPEEMVAASPVLGVSHAWGLLLNGSPVETIESRLQSLGEEAEALSGRVDALRAFVALFRGQALQAYELALRALGNLEEDDAFPRSVAAWMASVCDPESLGIAGSEEGLQQVARMSQGMGNVMVSTLVQCNLAELYVKQGQLHKAADAYRRALEIGVDRHGRLLPVAGEALMGLGELERKWNNFERATGYLVEGIDLIKNWSEVAAVDGYISLAMVRHAEGDAAGSQELMRKAEELAARFDVTELDDLVVALARAWLWIAQGDFESFQRLIEDWDLDGEMDALGSAKSFLQGRLRKYVDILLARFALAKKAPAEALSLMDGLLPQVRDEGRMALVIDIQILRARALQALGSEEQALEVLGDALAVAEPSGYVRQFVDEGPEMAQLLHAAAAAGLSPEYAGRLLAEFPIPDSATPHKEAAQDLIEPLSERELEVLQLIAEGLSNRAIADRVHLSLSTVKWHTGNIYSKLGVSNRTQAVAKGRGLGLLRN